MTPVGFAKEFNTLFTIMIAGERSGLVALKWTPELESPVHWCGRLVDRLLDVCNK